MILTKLLSFFSTYLLCSIDLENNSDAHFLLSSPVHFFRWSLSVELMVWFLFMYQKFGESTIAVLCLQVLHVGYQGNLFQSWHPNIWSESHGKWGLDLLFFLGVALRDPGVVYYPWSCLRCSHKQEALRWVTKKPGFKFVKFYLIKSSTVIHFFLNRFGLNLHRLL